MNFRTSFLALATLVMLAPAYAQGPGFDRHFYGFIGAGRADTEVGSGVADRIDGDDTAFEIGVGYTLSPHWSIEGSYQDFGDPDGFIGCPPDVFCIAIVPFAMESVSVDGWAVALRGEWPVYGPLSAFARVGALAWDTSAQASILDDSGTDLLWGVGIEGQLNDRFAVQLGYEKSGLETDAIRLGLRVRFQP